MTSSGGGGAVTGRTSGRRLGPTTRRALLRTVGAGALSIAGGCSTDDAGTAFLLGVYPGEPAAAPRTFRPFERWVGAKHATIPLYTNADLPDESIGDFVRDRMGVVWDTGHVPMVTWLPYRGSLEATPSDIERQIAAGQYDDYIDSWATRLAEWVHAAGGGRRLYFRPLPEMNGNWLPWSAIGPKASPTTFVEAWRHLHGRFSTAGLGDDRVQWVWNPNVREVGGVRTEAYYPGDEYVDWVGIDGYNFGDSREWSEWTGPEALFAPMVSRMRSLTGKPVGLPEFGSTSLRDGTYRPAAKSQWIADAYDYVERADVRMACWFNIDKETDWAVFGGTRGPGTSTLDGTTYSTYPAYRRAARQPTAITGGIDDGRILSHAQFTGTF